MRQSEPSRSAEQPDENPYAPPREEVRPDIDQNRSDQAASQRPERLRRESCIRVTGLLCLIVAIFAILTFGLGTLWELRAINSAGRGGVEPWMHQRWIVRMTSVISLAVIAAVFSWGLFRLRNWGRWALTIVTTLPVPVLVYGWLLLYRSENLGLQENPNPGRLISLSVLSALSCPPLLFLMWSPKGRMVFSAGYLESTRQTPRLRLGCLGTLPAVAAAAAGFVSYLLLLMAILTILAMLRLIRSI